jgi:predicted transcriptional regulator
MDNVDIKIRVPTDLKDRLDALSRSSKRSLSELAIEALSRLTDRNDNEIEHIKRALEEARKPNARIIPHKQAMDWIRSRGTSSPMPRPRGRRRLPA